VIRLLFRQKTGAKKRRTREPYPPLLFDGERRTRRRSSASTRPRPFGLDVSEQQIAELKKNSVV
jgi:hypothetical protein